MLAHKLLKKEIHSEISRQTSSKIDFNIEDFLENITDWMFKIILFVGIPYLLFVFIQFLRIF